MDLRYGMNPHQRATATASITGDGPVRVLSGEPSYINLLDALNGWQLVAEAAATCAKPAAASFKHVSPAGAALAGAVDAVMQQTWRCTDDLSPIATAYVRARDCEHRASYGDFVAVSHPVDRSLAEVLRGVYSDGIIAPGFESGVIGVLGQKKGGAFVIIEVDPANAPSPWEEREVFGVVLRQERDDRPIETHVLDGLPPDARLDALLGVATLRYTQSNAVAFVRDGMAIGIGAGQQSRIACTEIAAARAATWWLRRHDIASTFDVDPKLRRQDRITALLQHLDSIDAAARDGWLTHLDGVTLASDGYIPFRDNIDFVAGYGVRYLVEPGGSGRNDEVERACADHGIIHVQTGVRLFHH